MRTERCPGGAGPAAGTPELRVGGFPARSDQPRALRTSGKATSSRAAIQLVLRHSPLPRNRLPRQGGVRRAGAGQDAKASSAAGNGIGKNNKRERGEKRQLVGDLEHPSSWDCDTKRDKFPPALSRRSAQRLRGQLSKTHRAEGKTAAAEGRAAILLPHCSCHNLFGVR